MDERITVYGLNQRGGRNVGVRVGSVSATINSEGAEHDDACVSVARSVANAADMGAQHLSEIAAMRTRLSAVASERDAACDALDHAISGKRRFNSAVLCKPAVGGAWDGPVWLLDPTKREGGFGLCFDSLADVRREYPELWVVGVADGGVLLDAFPMPAVSR